MSIILETLGILFGVYFISLPIVFWMLTNNVFVWRPHKYLIPFGKESDGTLLKKWLEPEGIRYWICKNPNQVDNRWVVLLHSWGRNSSRMVTRGQIYWERGYSLIFLDAWSHGQSRYRRITTALWFAQHAMKICDIEKIERPVIHGLSFGALAAVIFASNRPVKAVIAEALLHDIPGMYEGFMRVLRIPKFLYWWIVMIILRMDFPWKEIEPKNSLKKVNAPIFLVHGEKDTMFPPSRDFSKNVKLLKKSDWSWLVPNSLHSKMEAHPDYKRRIEAFLDTIEQSN